MHLRGRSKKECPSFRHGKLQGERYRALADSLTASAFPDLAIDLAPIFTIAP